MVFEDLARPTSSPSPGPQRMAMVHDRFLAFAFDVVLWIPMGLLFLKPLWKRIQYLEYTAEASGEFSGLIVLTTLLSICFFVAAESLMTWRWGGTPGKRIFHLRVIDLRTGAKPALGACLIRALTWCFELALLGIPFLEEMRVTERLNLPSRKEN